jgi:glycosyltransferase involved in cell wall biosynthesis
MHMASVTNAALQGMTPEVSVVVPTYRQPEKLARALASVAGAVGALHETIVVDDCPEGSAFVVARHYGARYIAKAGADRGVAASRNMGVQLARGRKLCFLNDCDLLVADGITRLLAADRPGITFGDYAFFNAHSRTEVNLVGTTLDTLLVSNQIPLGAFVVERAALLRPFDTRLSSHEDWDFVLSHASALHHVAGTVALVDRTNIEQASVPQRRRQLFWLDFLSIYARFPATHLSTARAHKMQSLGLQMPEEMLRFADTA